MRPTLLSFNVTGDRLNRLRFACMRQSILLSPAPPEDFAQPLGALCGLMPRAAETTPGEPLPGEMLVMANLSRLQAERLLAALKQARLFFPLKAVLTPTNAAWDAPRLYRELMAEREAIARQERAPHQADEEKPSV